MSQQCSWPTHSWPLEGRCPYYALLGLTQAPGFAGGSDLFMLNRLHGPKIGKNIEKTAKISQNAKKANKMRYIER